MSVNNKRRSLNQITTNEIMMKFKSKYDLYTYTTEQVSDSKTITLTIYTVVVQPATIIPCEQRVL